MVEVKLNDVTDPGWKTTELWLTSITGLVNILLASQAPTPATISLIVCLTAAAVVYLICRTTFKIKKLKWRPDEMVNFTLSQSDTSGSGHNA